MSGNPEPADRSSNEYRQVLQAELDALGRRHGWQRVGTTNWKSAGHTLTVSGSAPYQICVIRGDSVNYFDTPDLARAQVARVGGVTAPGSTASEGKEPGPVAVVVGVIAIVVAIGFTVCARGGSDDTTDAPITTVVPDRELKDYDQRTGVGPGECTDYGTDEGVVFCDEEVEGPGGGRVQCLELEGVRKCYETDERGVAVREVAPP